MEFKILCKGDFNQGSDFFPLISRGKQCVSICLMFLLKTLTLDVHDWTKQDLHDVMKYGDEMYRKIQKETLYPSGHDYLHPSELPENILYESNDFCYEFQGKVLQTFSGVFCERFVGNSSVFSLENAILSAYSGSGCAYYMLLVQGNAIGVFYDGQKFFIFDSHARDESGRSCSDGTCILGECSCLADLCFHLRDIVKSSCSVLFEELQFDLHVFKLAVTSKRKGKKRSLAHASTDHAKTKQRKTVSKPEILENLKTLLNLRIHFDHTGCDPNTIRNSFHDSIKDGPLYICSSCTQTFFKHSVQRVDRTKFKHRDVLLACLTGYKSVDDKEWVCRTCVGALASGKIPACSVANGLKFPEIPDELKLTQLEERLVAPRLTFMQIREMPRGGQLSLKGNVVNVPADVNTTVKTLPRMQCDEDTILLKFKRKMSYKHHMTFEKIRPNKVFEAAKWLVNSSILFRNEGIQVDENWINHYHQLSEDDNLSSMDDGKQVEDSPGEDETEQWTEDENFENRPTGNFDTLLHPADFREFNQILSLAPGEGKTPLGLFQDIFFRIFGFPDNLLRPNQAR